MDPASVKEAWSLVPAANGAFQVRGTRLTFLPSPALRPGTAYRLTVDARARSRSGAPLTPFTTRFTTAATLRVTSYAPDNGTQGVPVSGRIAISFSHPMVALSGIDAEIAKPRGWSFTIRPAVPGRGSWLGTSTWVYRPTAGLAPSTRYTLTLGGTVRDAWGQPLGRPLRWTFRTATPELVSRTPRNSSRYTAPRTTVSVTFSQPMAHDSTQRAFTLTGDGRRVAGRFVWNGTTVTFRPSAPLRAGAIYTADVATTARSANLHATLGRAARWSFRVAPYPQLTSLAPRRNGTVWASTQPVLPSYGGCCGTGGPYAVQLRFNTPMSKLSLDRHLTIQPSVGTFQTILFGPTRGGVSHYVISGEFDPSTRYTVTIGAGTRDAFGRPLPAPIVYPFTTSEMHPSVALFGMPDQVAIAFSAGQTARVPLQTIDIPSARLTLIRTTIAALGPVCGDCAPAGTRVRSWTENVPNVTNRIADPGVVLKTRNGSPLPAGLYWLRAQAPYAIPGWKGSDRYSRGWPPTSSELVAVNNVSLTLKVGTSSTLVWATDTRTGKPARGLTVRLVDYQGSTRTSGVTDARGLHLFRGYGNNGGTFAAVVNSGGRFGLAETYWQTDTSSPTYRSWLPCDPCGPGSSGGMYAYTDRPVYRPGQTVHYRAVLWRNNDEVYSRLGVRRVTVTARSGTGKQLLRRTVRLDRFGSVTGSFRLPAGAATGDGYLWIGARHLPGASTMFTVAAYRKPEFLTTVAAARQRYAQGDTARVDLRVRYVFGAPVVRQRVHWAAYAQQQAFTPPGWDAYTFIDWEALWQRWWSWMPTGGGGTALGTQIASGNGRTDSRGELAIALPVSLKGSALDRTVTVEVTATDANSQSVSGRATFQEFHSDLAIGLKTGTDTATAGRPTAVDVVAVHQDGTPVGGATLTATVLKRTYTSKLKRSQYGGTYWQPVPHDTQVSTQQLTTDAGGKATVTFTPATGGEYRVQLSGRDAAGNPTATAISIEVSAGGAVDWSGRQDKSITLTPDKSTYRVGETAHIFVPAPFSGATALVTVERGTIRRYWVTTLAGTSNTVDVPIRLDDVPNEYVTVTLYHGWRGSTAPEWRTGTTELHVSVDPRTIRVSLRQASARRHPGDRVTYTVTTTDAAGRPVSAQVSLALVDTAVLAMKDEVNPNILPAFYAEGPLGVTTSSEGAVSIDNLTLRPDIPIPPNQLANGMKQAAPRVPVTGGGGGGGFAGLAAGAALSTSADRARLSNPGVTLRSRFADTAYWRGAVTTDTAGQAHIRLTLPDNTTTWRLDARAVTAHQDVGQATATTLATRDLVLRPVLPRFLVQGDTLRVGVALNNRLRTAVTARVTVSATGLRLTSSATTVTVPARRERLLLWPATVPVSTRAVLTARAMPARAGVQGDAVQVALPVHPPLTEETTATLGQVYDRVRQFVVIPRRAVPVPGALTVQVRASLTAGLGDAYRTLRPSVYESNDDTAARVLAAASLRTVPQGITGLSPRVYRRLPTDVAVGVQKLLDMQWYDGGWPWFTDGTVVSSDPFVTADAIQAIAASGRSGPLVRRALGRARAYLRNQLTHVPAALRAHVLAVLAGSNDVQGATAERLYADSIRRLHLDPGPLSDLGAVLRRAGDRSDSRTVVASLQASVQAGATGAHWEAADAGPWAGPPIANTAEVLSTLLALSPGDPLAPAAARWLMLARTGDGWDTLRDTAQSIAALSAYARAAREGRARYRYQVLVGPRPALRSGYGPGRQSAVGRLSVPVATLRRPGRTPVDLTRAGAAGSLGTGPMYYLARLRYYLPAPGILSRDEGVAISRRYLTLGGKPIDSVRAGAPVKVELTVRTSQTLPYLRINDPIPAGTEPIDESLNTARQGLFRPPVIWWWWRPSATRQLEWYLTHSDLRDDRVSLYSYSLPPGTYRYTYLLQATVAGRYDVAPARAEEQFFPEVFGRSAGSTFTVR